MQELEHLLTNDGKIMKLRALGYSQTDIAKKLSISQPAVSQRMGTILRRTKSGSDDDLTFWELFMGIGAAHLLKKLFDESFRGGVD